MHCFCSVPGPEHKAGENRYKLCSHTGFCAVPIRPAALLTPGRQEGQASTGEAGGLPGLGRGAPPLWPRFPPGPWGRHPPGQDGDVNSCRLVPPGALGPALCRGSGHRMERQDRPARRSIWRGKQSFCLPHGQQGPCGDKTAHTPVSAQQKETGSQPRGHVAGQVPPAAQPSCASPGLPAGWARGWYLSPLPAPQPPESLWPLFCTQE